MKLSYAYDQAKREFFGEHVRDRPKLITLSPEMCAHIRKHHSTENFVYYPIGAEIRPLASLWGVMCEEIVGQRVPIKFH